MYAVRLNRTGLTRIDGFPERTADGVDLLADRTLQLSNEPGDAVAHGQILTEIEICLTTGTRNQSPRPARFVRELHRTESADSRSLS